MHRAHLPLSRFLSLILLGWLPLGVFAADQVLSAAAIGELRLLLDDKQALDGDEAKLESGLRLALQRLSGEGAASRLPRLRTTRADAQGRLQLDILLDSTAALPPLRDWVARLPAVRVDAAAGDELRAWVRWQDVAAIAARDEVRRIRRAMPARSSGVFARKVASNISQGVVAHAVAGARANLGITGLGQKICVMSDSVDFLGSVQSSGDLPAGIEVLPGQSGLGLGFVGEGTAMLEIAQLAFATAFTGVAAFAQNIRAMRFDADCDVIVDDIIYFNEPPFQDGPIAQAVAEVSADGALYFAASGNEGNLRHGRAGVYEGDFVDAGPLPALPGGTLNRFTVAGVGSSNQVRVLEQGFAATLFWSDPLGASGNDYDLFIMSPDLEHVLDAGFDTQDGDDDAFEITGQLLKEDRVVVWKANAAAPRHLHLNATRGRFNLATVGQTKGHSAAAAAFSVAAVDVFRASGQAFTGGAENPVEAFSSDGPRRMYFSADGGLLNPGQPSLLGNGGIVRLKPDFAAADGVATATPGFAQFYGTSAAAPHAAAIAALLRQADPALGAAAIRAAMAASALDIEDPGPDALGGAGIVMAHAALQAIAAAPIPRLRRGDVLLSVLDGDADLVAEPGETLELRIPLHNDGPAAATAVTATLASATPGVMVLRASAQYPVLAAASVAANTLPFRIALDPGYPCGQPLAFSLSVQYVGGSPGVSPQQLAAVELPVGSLGALVETRYAGPAVAIPDADLDGVVVDLAVAAPGVRVGDLDLRFNGDACSSDALATTVGLQHSFVGDLELSLIAPAATTVKLLQRPSAGVGDNHGNHLCQTLFDDQAPTALSDAASTSEPFTGVFRAQEGLARFAGTLADGIWQLRARDLAAPDAGQVRDFSVLIRPALCDLHTPELLHLDGFE